LRGLAPAARARFKQELVQRFLKEFGVRAKKGRRIMMED
jgi:hypothetical protein